jgi:hypothetical protein
MKFTPSNIHSSNRGRVEHDLFSRIQAPLGPAHLRSSASPRRHGEPTADAKRSFEDARARAELGHENTIVRSSPERGRTNRPAGTSVPDSSTVIDHVFQRCSGSLIIFVADSPV